MNKTVCVVVTYNRLGLLKKCIEAVKKQTFKDFDIIVVNNGSTDGTEEWLKSIKDLNVLSQPNLGGSGGFHNGLQYAYDKGYDYFWIMDDDGEPDKECLYKLMSGAIRGFHYVAPMLYTKEYKCHWPYLLKLSENYLSHGGGPFNAILLSRKLIETIGLPNIHYFIWGDEFEFLNRVRENYFHTTLIKDAIHYHKIPENNKNSIDNRIYFKIRNLIWNTRLSNGILRSKLNFYSSTIFVVLKFVFSYMLHFKMKELYNLLKGVKDGLLMDINKLKQGSEIIKR